ncbi:hypothetical protein I4U23_018561 [Adineta vaga]|nr:hypothetical protein I4U23_018561 [Adineta vaga]
MNCAETFVHNHRHSFDTLCLEGEYREDIWEIVDDGSDAITYQFHQRSNNSFSDRKMISGRLCHVRSRSHFANNIMHVSTDQFHSISAKEEDVDNRVMTFLAKRKYSSMSDMYILSSSPTINSLSDDMRSATDGEREKIYMKLQQILMTRFNVVFNSSDF